MIGQLWSFQNWQNSISYKSMHPLKFFFSNFVAFLGTLNFNVVTFRNHLVSQIDLKIKSIVSLSVKFIHSEKAKNVPHGFDLLFWYFQKI